MELPIDECNSPKEKIFTTVDYSVLMIMMTTHKQLISRITMIFLSRITWCHSRLQLTSSLTISLSIVVIKDHSGSYHTRTNGHWVTAIAT